MTESAPNGAAREKLWTPANVVTLVRICCVPVFVVAIISPWPAWFPQWSDAETWKPWIAAGIFVLLAATDGLDGYLARSRNEVTNFGKFMDPLADKRRVAAALLALVERSILPSWVALVILTREFIVSGIRMVAASQGVVIAASWYGKAKTVTQIVAIVLFIIKDSVVITDPEGVLHNPLYLVSWAVMIVALVLTIVSMLDYFVKARELLGFTSASRKADRAEIVLEDAVDLDACRVSAADVVAAAREARKTVATAESLTGGMVAAALTSVPGSSAVVRGGVVSYVDDVKHAVLGVDAGTLARCGAVSGEVACQMAQGAKDDLQADVAVAVTGIAGPGGAEEGKPVGTVWLAVADAQGVRAELCRFPGDRSEVRTRTVLRALAALKASLDGRQ